MKRCKNAYLEASEEFSGWPPGVGQSVTSACRLSYAHSRGPGSVGLPLAGGRSGGVIHERLRTKAETTKSTIPTILINDPNVVVELTKV